jgi:hypothetical protein
MRDLRNPDWKTWQSSLEDLLKEAVKNVRIQGTNIAGHSSRQFVGVSSPSLELSNMPYVLIA